MNNKSVHHQIQRIHMGYNKVPNKNVNTMKDSAMKRMESNQPHVPRALNDKYWWLVTSHCIEVENN